MTQTRTVQYGLGVDQRADLHLPDRSRGPVVCLLHGGFWRLPYGRDGMAAVASDLVSCGFAVWNMEYRRLGNPGGGWPGTIDDIAAGIDHLARLESEADDEARLDLDCVIVVGHSAGGHLALCEAARRRVREATQVHISAVVGLAPIADLAAAHDARLGCNAVSELIGGAPIWRSDRYRAASPSELLPIGVPQLIVHGTIDDTVPVEMSRRYVEAARAAGDTVEHVELPGTGHMDFLDPSSEAYATLRRWLLRMTGTSHGCPNAVRA